MLHSGSDIHPFTDHITFLPMMVIIVTILYKKMSVFNSQDTRLITFTSTDLELFYFKASCTPSHEIQGLH